MTKCAKPSHRPGPEGVRAVLFDTTDPEAPLLLLSWFAPSVTGIAFPSRWKNPIIVPLHKKGLSPDPEEFQLINRAQILSMLGKAVEKQLVKFLTTHNLKS